MQRGIGDQRISDDDGRYFFRQMHDLRLIDVDRERVCLDWRCADDGGDGDQQNQRPKPNSRLQRPIKAAILLSTTLRVIARRHGLGGTLMLKLTVNW